MPYNNAAIPPPEEITGSAALPLARVKRILQLDEDISQCSNNAAFVITVATEMFIRYLAEQGHNIVKSERKPRRNIQYKDLANAVARIDNLEFLSDVIPRTTTYGQYKAKKSQEYQAREAARSKGIESGQTTLDGKKPQQNGNHVISELNGDADEPTEAAEGKTQAVPLHVSDLVPRSNGALVFEHYEPKSKHRPDSSGDVEME